jgi:hypothetical protein
MPESAPAPIAGHKPIEPLLLTEEILAQAESWREECLRRWNEHDAVEIGRANLRSPVDDSQRTVVLFLRDRPSRAGDRAKGKVRRGLILPDNSEADGYTIAINRELIPRPDEDLLHALVHEISHAVDPCFDQDHEHLNPGGQPGPRALAWNEDATQPSELRAFVSMWTNSIRRWARAPKAISTH